MNSKHIDPMISMRVAPYRYSNYDILGLIAAVERQPEFGRELKRIKSADESPAHSTQSEVLTNGTNDKR